MKTKLLLFAFFGLLVQIASGQIFEINSPTNFNLNCALTASNYPTEISIYVFGDNGVGFLSNDKCANWQQLAIDPDNKRAIKSAIRANDSLLIVSGEKGLLKYSTDEGKTFQDLTLPETSPVNSLAYGGDSILFNHAKSITCWNLKTNQFKSITSHIKTAENQTCYLISSFNMTRVVCRSAFYPSNAKPVFAFSVKTAFPWAWGQLKNTYDSICSLSVVENYTLTSYIGKEAGKYVYEGYTTPSSLSTYQYRYFAELTKEQSIKSSAVIKGSYNFWHAGGGYDGKNGFIIKNGAVVKTTTTTLNSVINGNYGKQKQLSGEVIIVGNNGAIFSDCIDLAKAPIAVAIKDDYLVSDPTVSYGDSAVVDVSGSEIGVTYKILRGDTGGLVRTFAGTGQSWSFKVFSRLDNTYTILATKASYEVPLKDAAKVRVLVKVDYLVSDPKIQSGQTAVVTLSGSQIDLFYGLYSPDNVLLTTEVAGTGEAIEFQVKVTENVSLFVRVRRDNQLIDLNDRAVITIYPVSVRTIDLTKLAVFPNPCNDQVTISSYENCSVTISDINGRALQIFKLEQGDNNLSLLNLRPGIYFITTPSNVFKLIKQ